VQATRVDDVVTFATGAAKDNNFGGIDDGFLLRGLQASVAEDGVITDNGVFSIPQRRDSANAERVEVLRGSGSALYGQGGAGGVVNIVTKRPDATQTFAEAEASYSTFERLRGEFDINAPIMDGFAAMRIVGALEGTDSFRYDDAFDEAWPSDRVFIAPSLLFGQGTDTRLLLSGEYLRDDTPFDRGIVTDEDGNPLVSADQFLGDPATGPITTEKIKLRTELEHDFNEDWSVRATGTYLDNEIEGEAVEPRARIDSGLLDVNLGGVTIGDAQFSAAQGACDPLNPSPPPFCGVLIDSSFGPNDPLEEGDILRLFRDRDQEDDLLSGRVDLNGIVRTGFLTHNLLFSAEHSSAEGDSRIDFTSEGAAFTDSVVSGRSSPFILNGSTLDLSNAPSGALVDSILITDEELDTTGFVINDKIDIGEQVHLLLGGRYDIIDQTVVSTTFDGLRAGSCANGPDMTTCIADPDGPDVTEIEEEKFSPRAGLVVEPFVNTPFSLFFGYTEGIRANTAKTGTGSVEEAVLPPQEFTSYEGGFRYGFFDNRLAFTATVFSIDIENFPIAEGNETIGADVESEGVELNLQGAITPEWSILANYAYTDAVLTDGPALAVGTRQPGSPEHSASLVSKYQFMDGPYRGFFGTLGLVYHDERVNTIPQEQSVSGVTIPFDETRLPEFVRLDLSAGYEFESGSVFEVGVQNVLDEDILQPSIAPGIAYPERPVTGFVRFKGKF
jgi:iron complex outermembrane receptor protein